MKAPKTQKVDKREEKRASNNEFQTFDATKNLEEIGNLDDEIDYYEKQLKIKGDTKSKHKL